MTPAAAQMIDACPVTNRRPRDLETYQAACAATDEGRIQEYDAVQVQVDWSVWHFGHWLTVVHVEQEVDRDAMVRGVEFRLADQDGTTQAVRYCKLTQPVYRHTAD